MLYRLAIKINKLVAGDPFKANIPIICIGNLTVGGNGKTPLAIAIGNHLQNKGYRLAFLSRGFGGRIKKPLAVDLHLHDHFAVGDEALMLARIAPTYVGSNRSLAAKMAMADGADILVMDDGMQHHSLHKDLTILAIDSKYKFGNELMLPAGPLREPLADGLSKADVIVYTGAIQGLKRTYDKPLFNVGYQIANCEEIAHKSFIAICSIALPEKFFETATAAGATIMEKHIYPDHYNYTAKEIDNLLSRANQLGVKVLTTSKDAIKLNPDQQKKVVVLNLALEGSDQLNQYIDNWLNNFNKK
jgi:tetraacyldisaccharide 4'-kinase